MGRFFRRSSAVGAVAAIIVLALPGTAFADAYKTEGWYNNFPTGSGYQAPCGSTMLAMGSTTVQFTPCAFWAIDSSGFQSWTLAFQNEGVTIKVSSSTGFVDSSGATVLAFTSSTDRLMPNPSFASYFGATWNNPGACLQFAATRFVYANMVNFDGTAGPIFFAC